MIYLRYDQDLLCKGTVFISFLGADSIACELLSGTQYSIPIVLFADVLLYLITNSFIRDMPRTQKRLTVMGDQLLSTVPIIAGGILGAELLQSRSSWTTSIAKNIGMGGQLLTVGMPPLSQAFILPAFLGTVLVENRVRERLDTFSQSHLQRRSPDSSMGQEKLDIAVIGSTLRRIDSDATLGYAGTERVNRSLIEQMVSRGHSVVYFGPGDSHVAGDLVPTVAKELWSDPKYKRETRNGKIQMYLDSISKTFDIVHEYARKHGDAIFHFSVDESLRESRFDSLKTVTTIHGDTSFPHLQTTFSNPSIRKRPIVFVSNAQRGFLPQANCVGVVHNSTVLDGVRASYKPGSYLVEVCRLSPEKAPHIPMLVAERLKMPIEIMGPDPRTPESDVYLKEVFWPIYKRVHGKGLANYRGKVSTAEKDSVVRRAAAGFMLSGMYMDKEIQPRRYIEAFGLTSIEYQKFGTPSISSAYGACPETVLNGVTGYVCKDQSEALWATERVLDGKIDRHSPVKFVRDKFSPKKMADGYETVYRLVDKAKKQELLQAVHA